MFTWKFYVFLEHICTSSWDRLPSILCGLTVEYICWWCWQKWPTARVCHCCSQNAYRLHQHWDTSFLLTLNPHLKSSCENHFLVSLHFWYFPPPLEHLLLAQEWIFLDMLCILHSWVSTSTVRLTPENKALATKLLLSRLHYDSPRFLSTLPFLSSPRNWTVRIGCWDFFFKATITWASRLSVL